MTPALVWTTKTTKRIGCASLKTLIEMDKLLVTDYDIIYELSTFISKGTSFEAEEGKHDDMVMCCVLFSWLANQEYFKELTSADIRSNIYNENIKAIEDSVLPFGIIDDGRDELLSDVNEMGHSIDSNYGQYHPDF